MESISRPPLSSVREALPLLAGPGDAPIAWRDGRPISRARFLADASALAGRLPEGTAAVNLCEERYAFLLTFCALLLKGQANLLPWSRAPQAIIEVMAAHPGSYAVGERELSAAPAGYHLLRLDELVATTGPFLVPAIPCEQLAVTAYTSGSTGTPRAHSKRWADLHASNAGNLRMLGQCVGEALTMVATVPPQHIFGLETSILLPLLGDTATHVGRPFFPIEVAAALAEIAAPRLLVTTPVHLRALLSSGVELPPLAGLLSATSPLPRELAQAAERVYTTRVFEIFGSTETCALASRRSASDEAWQLYPGVEVSPQSAGMRVSAPQLPEPVEMADLVSVQDGGRRFRLHGRHVDLLEIGGKRASLGDLTRRLLAIPGVLDGVMLQLDETDASGVRRIAAVVVAPDIGEEAILSALRPALDPVFMPRRLCLVETMPRNETGKLSRETLLKLFSGGEQATPASSKADRVIG